MENAGEVVISGVCRAKGGGAFAVIVHSGAEVAVLVPFLHLCDNRNTAVFQKCVKLSSQHFLHFQDLL